MADIIILLIVLVVIIFAVKGTIKHFKGEGGCCGGGGKGLVDSTKKTLEHPKIGEKTVKISGMHCDHCVGSVAAAINKIDGAAAKVNLKKEEAVVSYDRQISDDEIRNAVEDAGFTVVSIC